MLTELSIVKRISELGFYYYEPNTLIMLRFIFETINKHDNPTLKKKSPNLNFKSIQNSNIIKVK